MQLNTIAVPAVIRTYHVVQPRFDMLYPVVELSHQPHVAHMINQRITGEIQRMIADQSQDPQTSITGGYEIKTNERNILSISIIVYSFSGGAHGITVINSLTFDLTTGHVYSLAELFKPNSGYMERINQIIRKQIHERQLPLINEFTGIKPNQDFYIADKSLIIYFQLYDLLPYAYGFPYFPISVYELSDIVREDGALGRMMS